MWVLLSANSPTNFSLFLHPFIQLFLKAFVMHLLHAKFFRKPGQKYKERILVYPERVVKYFHAGNGSALFIKNGCIYSHQLEEKIT